MPRGGARPGSGPKKGTKYAKTINKALAREEARTYIQRQMPRMMRAQIEAACGVAHLFIRAADGTFSRAPSNMTAAAMSVVLNGDRNRFYIATKDPNTQAFTILAGYALDKPKEQAQDIEVQGDLVIRWKGTAE